MIMPMGIYDAPEKQEQPTFYIDLLKTNVAIFGGAMSGKTTFLQTMLVRLNQMQDSVYKENTYIIDFGGNIGKFEELPSVCAYFDNSNEENIKRVFKTLDARMKENAKQIGSDNYRSYYKKHPEECPAHLTLIIENLTSFLSDDRYSTYRDVLIHLCRDGLTKGLSVVFTANEVNGTGRIMSYFGQKIAFEMPTDSYFSIFNTKVIKPMPIEGRGLMNLGTSVFEFQAFFPYVNESEIDDLCRNAAKQKNRMISFPEILTSENYTQYCKRSDKQLFNQDCSEYSALIGLDYYEQQPVYIDLEECRAVGIYGRRQFGKTNLLKLLLKSITGREGEVRIVLLDDGRKQLHGLLGDTNIESIYLTGVDEFRDYLIENGYDTDVRRKTNITPVITKQNPYTVFILQSKSLYQSGDIPALTYLRKQIPYMIANAEEKGYLFIFSDVQRITRVDFQSDFNSSISVSVLLDDIGDFIINKGSKSVFGEMDAKELKSEYARCSLGDGFIYYTESDELRKVKILKNEE